MNHNHGKGMWALHTNAKGHNKDQDNKDKKAKPRKETPAACPSSQKSILMLQKLQLRTLATASNAITCGQQ